MRLSHLLLTTLMQYNFIMH